MLDELQRDRRVRLAGAVRRLRNYFEDVVRRWDRDDLSRGVALANRLHELVETPESLEPRAALALALDVNRAWLEEHFGASGWGMLRVYAIDALLLATELRPAEVDADSLAPLAASFARHFVALGWEQSAALARRWEAAIHARDGAAGALLIIQASDMEAAGKAGGHGFVELIERWAHAAGGGDGA